MTTVLIIISLLLFLTFRKEPNKVGIKKFIIIISLLLIFVSTFRHEGVGNDTLGYMHFFDSMDTRTWSEYLSSFITNYLNPVGGEDKDPGFNVFIKFIHDIVPDVRFFFFVVATILLTPIGVFVYKYSTNIKVTLFFYIFYICLFYHYLPNSAIRQSIAMSLVLTAYMFLEKKRIVFFLLFVLLGSFMHKSCLIVLLMIPISLLVEAKLFYKISALLFILGLVFSDQMALLFMDQSDVYNSYLTSQYYGGFNGSRPIMVLFLFLALYIVGWMAVSSVGKDYVTKLFLIGTALTLVFVPLVWVNPSLLRVISYFSPFMGIFIGEALNRVKYGELLRTIIIIVFIYHSLSSSSQYRFMWQEMKINDDQAYNINQPEEEQIETIAKYLA